jgi:hypothetical protein
MIPEVPSGSQAISVRRWPTSIGSICNFPIPDFGDYSLANAGGLQHLMVDITRFAKRPAEPSVGAPTEPSAGLSAEPSAGLSADDSVFSPGFRIWVALRGGSSLGLVLGRYREPSMVETIWSDNNGKEGYTSLFDWRHVPVHDGLRKRQLLSTSPIS